MAEEAVILWAIQKLETVVVENPSMKTSSQQIMKEVITELRMMLDFLRDKESGERSKLNYLLADFVEMAQVSVDITRNIRYYLFDKKMATARDWLRKTKKRMTNLGVGGEETRPQSVDQEERDEEGGLVGLEEDVRQLIDKAILNKDPQLLTSCIKGMLGVGKTTLARQVYNHAAVIEKFERRAWVRISGDMSMKEVLVELIQKLVVGSEELERNLFLENMDNWSLQQILRQHLQGVSFFIVVDNMLEETRLESILVGLSYQNHGSRLLFTSRYRIREGMLHYTHHMNPLDPDKSWELFLKTMSCGNKFTIDELELPKHLERKGREMLKKCGGLPISIIDVGRQKAKQRLAGIEWEELFDSIDLGESLKLLEEVYDKLNSQLKACFLHMSFFKENATLREEKLEQIWAARRINTRSSITCTYDLVGASIIEAAYDFQYPSFVKKYRINPLLHMLSIKKAEQEMGFEILSSNGNSRSSQNPRHRVVQCGREKFNHSTNRDKDLVSLIFHGGGRYLDDASSSYWESFEHLNILDLEDFGLKILSETIGTLMELRYLGLRNNYIQEIPHSFGGLKKLQTLDIALNFLVEVSDIIGEMVSLRHLHMSDVIFRKPLNIGALQNLATLNYISIYDWTYEVEKMARLCKLGIEEVDENSDISKLFASLAKLEKLSWLILRGFRFRSMPCLDKLDILGKLRVLKVDGLLARLPSFHDFPQFITYLVLINTCLDEDPMPVLGYLPNLKVLKLRNAYTGQQMVFEYRTFIALHVLRINELWNLRNLQVGKRAMTWLRELEIKNCPYLETLPEEIGSMKNLKKLKMVTTKHIATKIKNSGLIPDILDVDIGPYII